MPSWLIAVTLIASASRRDAPNMLAGGFLHTYKARHFLMSSSLLRCVCASACPLFRSRCLLSALCAKRKLILGMRSRALPCVGAR